MSSVWPILSIALAVSAASSSSAPSSPGPASLRLTPWPKQIALRAGMFAFPRRCVLRVTGGGAAPSVARELRDEVKRACAADITIEEIARSGSSWRLQLGSAGARAGEVPDRPEAYALEVTPVGIAAEAREEAGLVWAMRTLQQLVRANLRGSAVPCVAIADWPSFRYRGTQDDITRGPSPRLETLEREVRLASELRLNFFTTYQESQFAYAKHPEFGPKDGSLTPGELRAWVEYAKTQGVEIIGNQQSFGHFGSLLAHPQYADLRETPDILNPTNERTYALLDDLYSEMAPLTDSPLFNVCCDETQGLGTGPSKALAERIGVGGVYLRHIRRIHDLLRDKYHKRMMMWGDILLMHPEKIGEAPADTIFLSWGYDDRASWEDAIAPFAKSGHEFFVCPGVSNWSRILPDFGVAVANNRNYLRDGLRQGAIGALNTVWNDDGETLFAPNWHGIAWGAECAWNGSTTPYADFNRRVGGALFGEPGDHFGKAIDLLAKTHRLPAYQGMMDSRFWAPDLGAPVGRAERARQARELLAIVDPALAHLRAARRDARVNGDLLDHFIFGAERMRLMATRSLDLLRASDLYARARAASSADAAIRLAEQARSVVAAVRDRHAALKNEFIRLWNTEKKPYSLDRVTARYDAYAAGYERVIAKLDAALADVRSGRPLPSGAEIGLAVGEAPTGCAVTHVETPLAPDAPWAAAGSATRVGLVLRAGGASRLDLPVVLDLPGPPAGDPRAYRLMALDPESGAQTPAPCQVCRIDGRWMLAFVAHGRMTERGERAYYLYSGADPATWAGPRVTVTPAANGGLWVQNGAFRLLIGREGGHIYRWEPAALGGRDLTEPGEKDWAGFADINGPYRNARNRLEALASGPLLARIRCTDTNGMRKTLDIWAGAPWVDCTLSAPTSYFACFDDPALLGPASSNPGVFLFEDGWSGPVKPVTNGTDSQERRSGQRWCAKYAPGAALLALLTPEVRTTHLVGPGGGMGGVVVEGGAGASHFVMVGGACPPSPAEALNALCETMDRSRPVQALVHAIEGR